MNFSKSNGGSSSSTSAEEKSRWRISSSVKSAASAATVATSRLLKRSTVILTAQVSSSSQLGNAILSSNLTRFAFEHLKAPPRVLGCPNWIVPGADMEDTYFPRLGDIIDVVTGDFFPERKSNRRGIRNWDDRDLARRAL